ncbi:MAG TPA: hypothetical protein VGP80_09930 [Gemmatimonadales bacterium]|nr:hypothetical protein [Gemmatimonadales bacterium]
MQKPRSAVLLAVLATAVLASPAAAQDSIPLAVGTVAPDFELPGATREGVTGRLRLSDFRDQTVVIAFFYRARTRG